MTKTIVAGGTIDKVYDMYTETMNFEHLASVEGDKHIEAAAAAQMVKNRKFPLHTYTIEFLMALDSLDMEDSHRLEIVEACHATDHKQIVVTHGTGTMVETAQVVSEKKSDKTVVLTGAMRPYSVAGSDASDNFWLAQYASELMPSGVYIAMSGLVLPADNARKNLDKMCFEPLDPTDPRIGFAVAKSGIGRVLQFAREQATGRPSPSRIAHVGQGSAVYETMAA